MASRRMFHIDKIQTDEFLSLSPECQALFFHAMLTADDDGFIARPVAMTRMVNCSREALETLVKEGFLIRFPSGVVVVKHWHVHNCIRHDRYHASILPERELVGVNEYNEYYLLEEKEQPQCQPATPKAQVEQLAEEKQQEEQKAPEKGAVSLGSQWEPEVRSGKARIDYGKQDQAKALLSVDSTTPPCSPLESTTIQSKRPVLPNGSNITREGLALLKQAYPELVRDHPERFIPREESTG